MMFRTHETSLSSSVILAAFSLCVSVSPGVAATTKPADGDWYDLPWLGRPAITLPVIASEREIGISALGMLGNYKEYPQRPSTYDRELGWTPGLKIEAHDIFDLGRLHGLYAGAEGQFTTGNVVYHGSWTSRFADRSGPSETSTNEVKASGRVELGKAWVLTRRLLLITAAQGGYGYWDRSVDSGWATLKDHPNDHVYVHGYDERYRYAWGGGTVHVDYAITPRLVGKVSGSVGETFQGRMQASTTPATFYLGDRLRLEGGLALDYRATARIHLLADVDYLQFGFGRSHDVRAASYETLYEPSSRTQQLQLGVGVAIGF